MPAMVVCVVVAPATGGGKFRPPLPVVAALPRTTEIAPWKPTASRCLRTAATTAASGIALFSRANTRAPAASRLNEMTTSSATKFSKPRALTLSMAAIAAAIC